MISKVDLRDWDRVDFHKIRNVLADLVYQRDIEKSFETMQMWINYTERIRDKQMDDAKRKIPVILRKGEE